MCWWTFILGCLPQKREGRWYMGLMLHGAANCFNTCIHEISSQPEYSDVIINPQGEDADRERLILGHLCELHYVSLIPRRLPEVSWPLHCNVSYKDTFAIEVVVVVIVLKWKYVMSNSCRLSGAMVLESRVTDDCDTYAIWFSETKVNSTQVTGIFRV